MNVKKCQCQNADADSVARSLHPTCIENSVTTPANPPPSLPELRVRVDSAIKASPHLSGHQVFCQEEPGIIVLHGRVDSFFQKQMAQEALKRLDGVERVINELEVEWMGSLR